MSGRANESIDAPGRTHRIVALIAAVSLLPVLAALWDTTVVQSPGGAVPAAVGIPLALVWAGGALAARRRRTLVRLDALGLLAGVVSRADDIVRAFRGHAPLSVDETILCRLAARALAAGRNPYAGTWTSDVATHHATLLMNGGVADRFGYPPLDVLLAAGVHLLLPAASEVAVVSWLALLATAGWLYLRLPVPLRALTVLAVFSLGAMPMLARYGYPLALATFLLLVALDGWPAIGAGGRLGRRGTVAAIALGLAAATQQLTWFVIPFLLVLLWRVRAGDVQADAARGTVHGLMARFTSIAAATFAAVNLPFLAAGPGSWLRGVLGPLRQHAFYSGPGLANVDLHWLGGSGALDFYRYAGLAFLATGIALAALWPAQLGLAVLVVPFAAFWLSMRSQLLYYEAFVPLGLLLVATPSADALAAARPLPLPRRVRVALPALGVTAVVACLSIAAAWPAPIRSGRAVVALAGRTPRPVGIDVELVNRSGDVLHPHFATDFGSKSSLYWRVLRGTPVLWPGERASYELLPPAAQTHRLPPPRRLFVITDDPQTISVIALPSAAARSTRSPLHVGGT